MSMPSLEVVERVIWLLTVVGSGGVAVRLWQLNLSRSYPCFFWYLIISTCRSLLLWPFYGKPPGSLASLVYGWIWKLTAPLLWAFYLLIVLELYSLVFRNHRGIYTMGRWAIFGAFAIALVISGASLVPTWVASNDPQPRLQYITTIERGVASSLVVFLFLILLFLAWYPIPLGRNVVVHSIVYSVYFTSGALGLLVVNLAGYESYYRWVSNFLVGITGACLLAWLVLLNRAGEAKTIVLRSDWKPPDEKRLIEQLNTLNSTLLRAARNAPQRSRI